MDVIASRRTGFETYGVRDDERGSFRFRLPDLARGAAAAIATMQEFMRLCCAQHKRIYVALGVDSCRKRGDSCGQAPHNNGAGSGKLQDSIGMSFSSLRTTLKSGRIPG